MSLIDIARKTGLSRSTIDRVLNDRPGVKQETRERVQKALSELGYAPDALSALRRAVPKRIEIFLSEGSNPLFANLRRGFELALGEIASENIDAQLAGFDPYLPDTVVAALRGVSPETETVITVGVDTPDVVAAINALEERGVRVITIVSDVPTSGRSRYVGQDNFRAGQTVGQLMLNTLGGRVGTVATMLGHLQFRHLLDRRSGFEQVIGLARPDLQLVTARPYGSGAVEGDALLRQLIDQHADLIGLYLCGGGQPGLYSAFDASLPAETVIIGHEVSGLSRAALQKGTFDFLVAHDVSEVGRKALRAALDPSSVQNADCSVNIYVEQNLPLPLTSATGQIQP